ncbi:MAG: hypothetical protein WBL88_00055 [Nitrososphaeraceae archaeon]
MVRTTSNVFAKTKIMQTQLRKEVIQKPYGKLKQYWCFGTNLYPNNSKSDGIVGLAYKGNQGDLGI